MYIVPLKKKFCTWLSIAFLFFIPTAFSQQNKPQQPEQNQSKDKVEQYFTKGKKAFHANQFDVAVDNFSAIVKLEKKNYDAATWLGASYFNIGVPKRALRYLNFSAKKTTLTSFNYFYQGLSYDAINNREKARENYKIAAMQENDYAYRSMFELGVTDYNNKAYPQAEHWLNLYIQKNPNGPYATTAKDLISDIKRGVHRKNVAGVKKPSMDAATYKYSPYSLYPAPHYWFAQFGFLLEEKTLNYPTGTGALEAKVNQKQALVTNTGIGFGPQRKGRATVMGGYTYRQNWYTDGQRIEEYLDDWTDFAYQPYRLDLLERKHDFFIDLRLELPFNFYTGLYWKYEIARIGTSFYSGPESQTFDPKVQKISDTTLTIPWIGYQWGENSRSLAYFYFRKQINDETPEFSNKSYNFGSGEKVPLSLGLSHNQVFPSIKLDLTGEIFQYSFIANDYWLDYTRQGAIASMEVHVFKGVYATLLGGYYKDHYPESIFKSKGCKYVAPDANGVIVEESGSPSECYREDSGYIVKAGFFWNYSISQRIGGEFSYFVNQNPDQPEFDSKATAIKLMATLAFPDVKRVSRYVDRFSDHAFTKEAE